MKKLLLFTLILWLCAHTSYAKSNQYEQKVEQSLKSQEISYESLESGLNSGKIKSYDEFLKNLRSATSIHEDINLFLYDKEMQVDILDASKKQRKVLCKKYKKFRMQQEQLENKEISLYQQASSLFLKDIKIKIPADEYVKDRMIKYFVYGVGSVLYDVKDPDSFKFVSNKKYFLLNDEKELLVQYIGKINLKTAYGNYAGYKPCIITLNLKKDEIKDFRHKEPDSVRYAVENICE